jgi:hypothetical protein
MMKQIHCCQSVAGAIRNWKKSDWKRNAKSITVDGKYLTGEQLRDKFITILSEGTKYLPIGDCDNFDPQNGCRGHEIADEEQ